MSEFLSEVRGFTPVIDVLAGELGGIAALVYGVVWRFCQMRDGICRASMETLAKRVGLNRATVLKHIKRLCEAGYLEDTTPDRRNVPHVYRDTGKVIIRGLVEARLSETVSQDNSSVESVAVSNTTVAHVTPTVSQGNKSVAYVHMKKQSGDSFKKQEESIIIPGDQNSSPLQGGADGDDDDNDALSGREKECWERIKAMLPKMTTGERGEAKRAIRYCGADLVLDVIERSEPYRPQSWGYFRKGLQGAIEQGISASDGYELTDRVITYIDPNTGECVQKVVKDTVPRREPRFSMNWTNGEVTPLRPRGCDFSNMTDEERLKLALERNARYRDDADSSEITEYYDEFKGQIVKTGGNHVDGGDS